MMRIRRDFPLLRRIFSLRCGTDVAESSLGSKLIRIWVCFCIGWLSYDFGRIYIPLDLEVRWMDFVVVFFLLVDRVPSGVFLLL